MEKEFSVEGITNINDVARFNLKLEFIIHSIQRHKELREMSHKEFVRRMNNITISRQCLLERRRKRHELNKLQTDLMARETLETDTNLEGEQSKNNSNDALLVEKLTHHGKDNRQKGVVFDSPDRSTVIAGRNSRSPGSGKKNFRRISLTIGNALRVGSRRRTQPSEAKLYVGKFKTGPAEYKLVRSTSDSSGTSSNGFGRSKERLRSKTAHGRKEPHLAVTRKSLAKQGSARDKVKDMLTRLKVIKRFQNNIEHKQSSGNGSERKEKQDTDECADDLKKLSKALPFLSL